MLSVVVAVPLAPAVVVVVVVPVVPAVPVVLVPFAVPVVVPTFVVVPSVVVPVFCPSWFPSCSPLFCVSSFTVACSFGALVLVLVSSLETCSFPKSAASVFPLSFKNTTVPVTAIIANITTIMLTIIVVFLFGILKFSAI